MKYLLDTNICIALLKGEPVIAGFLKELNPANVYLCSVVKAELLYGCKKSKKRSHNEEVLKVFFREFQSLAFDDECAEQYGNIRSTLEQSGSVIGPNDLMIAAIAQQHELTLVTRNTDEFERIPTLAVECW